MIISDKDNNTIVTRAKEVSNFLMEQLGDEDGYQFKRFEIRVVDKDGSESIFHYFNGGSSGFIKGVSLDEFYIQASEGK